MREEIVLTKSNIVLVKSELVSLESRMVPMESGRVQNNREGGVHPYPSTKADKGGSQGGGG
jgi:hypothetical protein